MARPLFRPNTNHTCHKKPNPSRETVPLSAYKRSYRYTLLLAIIKGTIKLWKVALILIVGDLYVNLQMVNTSS
jgi:hypothetical protein